MFQSFLIVQLQAKQEYVRCIGDLLGPGTGSTFRVIGGIERRVVCEMDVDSPDCSRASDLDRRRRLDAAAGVLRGLSVNLRSLLYLGTKENRAIVDSVFDFGFLAAWK
jgi:hypothetical protein